LPLIIQEPEKYAVMVIVAPGLSQRTRRTSSARGSDTQPFVAWPVSTWRNIAEPRPGMRAVLYSSTAKRR